MNAKEAKQKALAVNTETENSQYAKIILMISNAVSRGEYEMWFYENIKEDVKNKLVEQGYDVGKTQFERNEIMTKIKWSELNISDVRSSETIDARKIVINCLKMYNLTEVEEMNYHGDLANEIINDLVNAKFMK